MKENRPKWPRAENFLVCNLAGSRTHFKESGETIHPFSKSNQDESNWKRLWSGAWMPKEYTFYDSTVIKTKTKANKSKEREEKGNDRAHFTLYVKNMS